MSITFDAQGELVTESHLDAKLKTEIEPAKAGITKRVAGPLIVQAAVIAALVKPL